MSRSSRARGSTRSTGGPRSCASRTTCSRRTTTGTTRWTSGLRTRTFLTHLHNGHTAPESDGQPHYSYYRFAPTTASRTTAAWKPGEWVDQLYLGYPAGGDEREKQSFFWFHDHVHGFTGANVYKGMVGTDAALRPDDGQRRRDGNGYAAAGRPHELRRQLVRRRLRHPAGAVRLPAGRRRHAAQGRPQRQRRDAPRVVGQVVFPSLPQPRLRGRHLHRERHGVPGDGGQAAQVPPAVPRRVDLAHLRPPAHDSATRRPRATSATSATSSRASTASRTASSA